TGAKPVFADIDARTYNLDAKKLESAVSKRTKVIIPVHLFGQPADMTEILAFAKAHKLKVIEDACQAHGARYQQKPVGSMGDAGCFSFYPTKNLGGFGDGGMIVTQSRPLYKRLKLLRDCGRKGKYNHIIKGYNSRLDSVQAAVLIPKLKRLGRWNSRRQKHAQLYARLLSDNPKIIPPLAKEDRTHVYHVYSVRIKNRDRVSKKLQQQGVGCAIYYPAPLHLQKAYQELGYNRGVLPVAEQVCREILALPMHPNLTAKEISLVCRRLLEAL
ncbi:MAG: DegT/DnrJ/EryC1/StrS family aminotransferase, partial [Candidatus Omnitrophota bacterium]